MEECIICFEETNPFVFFPCAHKVCQTCYKRMVRCPICNTVDPENQVVRYVQPQQSYMCSRVCSLYLLAFSAYVVYETVKQYE
jgi:hypothetical protein